MSRTSRWCASLALGIATTAHADGSGIDKIYDPYVNLLEHELEYRTLYQYDEDPAREGDQWHKIGYGQTLAEHWAGEIYAIGEEGFDGDFGIDAVELELKHQLTEQGEYAVDWGALLEVEHSTERNAWETTATLIAQRDWQHWTGVANLSAIYEWGEHLDAEFETRLKVQLRYRYSPLLEPALELYSGEESKGVGPALIGNWRFGGGRNLHWETAAIFGLDRETADTSLKLTLEYEF